MNFMQGTVPMRRLSVSGLRKMMSSSPRTPRHGMILECQHWSRTATDLISGYHLALLRPRTDELAGGYLLRALQSKGLAYQFHIEAKGVTRYGLSHAGIKSVWLPLPPLPEQTAIVRFLDHADRRIRRYIRAKQKLIALLEEQKQAIIHQAVTGQIDVRTGQPYPSYKPSGVEWLGDVPEHWEMRRTKSLFRLRTEKSDSAGRELLGRFTNILAYVPERTLRRKAIKLRSTDDKLDCEKRR